MKRLSRNDIEGIGQRVVNAYMKLPEFAGQTIYRIDPEILCERVLGIDIDSYRLSLCGDLLGLTSPGEIEVQVYNADDDTFICNLDGRTVLVDIDLKMDVTLKGRYNFTVAHEASHQIFKMVFPKEYGVRPGEKPPVHFYRPGTERNLPIKDWGEWQANALASAILLPRCLIEQGMYFFGLGEQIELLNKIYCPYVYERFACLADFLGSSKTALAIRMKQLGLLKTDQLQNPYEYLNIFK